MNLAVPKYEVNDHVLAPVDGWHNEYIRCRIISIDLWKEEVRYQVTHPDWGDTFMLEAMVLPCGYDLVVFDKDDVDVCDGETVDVSNGQAVECTGIDGQGRKLYRDVKYR